MGRLTTRVTRRETPLTVVKRILVGRCTYTTIKHCDSSTRKFSLNFGKIWLAPAQPLGTGPANSPFDGFCGKLSVGDSGACEQWAVSIGTLRDGT